MKRVNFKFRMMPQCKNIICGLNNKFFNRLLLLGLAVMTMSVNVWGQYTITFKTGSGDGSSMSTSTSCSSYATSGCDYVSSVSTATKISYNGDYGLKMGTSSAAGTFKITLKSAGQVKATSIVVNAKRYNSSKAATVNINTNVASGTAQSVTSSFDNYTFTQSTSPTTNITYIEIVSSKYIWVSSITVNYSAGCTDPEITTQPQGATYTKDATPTALSITATGADAYQWYSNTSSSTSGASAISGATSSTYTPSTATVGTKYYYCVASKSTCTATSSIVAVVVNAPSYTVTASSNDENLGTVSITNNIITASPESCVGYASPAYTVTSGTAEVSQNGNEFTVTPTANCSIQINFAALLVDTYTDNLHNQSTTRCGKGYTIPSCTDASTSQSSDCVTGHYKFIGWSTSSFSQGKTSTGDVPGFFAASGTKNATGATYYAVWGKEDTSK